MATPNYQGPGQPIADNGNGWLGRLGSFFGGTTPAYASAPSSKVTDQPATVSSTPSAPSPNGQPIDLPSEALAMCPIDPTAIPSGQIVLVVPRNTGG